MNAPMRPVRRSWILAALAVAGCTVTNLPTSAPPSADITQAPAAAPSSTVLAAAPAPPDAPSYDANGMIYPDPLCTQVGGDTIENINGGPTCSQIAYLGTDGQTYYTGAPINQDGTLQGPADTAGTGATESECTAGYYPDGSAGPVHAAPGKWNATLQLCQQ
jgi:hypothetical protein